MEKHTEGDPDETSPRACVSFILGDARENCWHKLKAQSSPTWCDAHWGNNFFLLVHKR